MRFTSRSQRSKLWQQRWAAKAAWAAPVTLAMASGVAHAQFRASIQGTIADPTGAVIPNAKVTLRDTGTNRTLTVTSNADGTYSFNALPPDQFDLTVTAAGFQAKAIQNLAITPEQANSVNVQLNLGESSTTVTVSGNTVPNIDTATANLQGTITSNEIQHLPTSGRDVFQLAQLAPGSFGDGQKSGSGGTNSLPGNQGPGGPNNQQGSFDTENGPQVQANGGQYENNSISIDGISTTSAVWGGTTIITPNEDSVENVKITSNGYDAEFGRFSGANMQVTTKSGTNQFHGSAFFRVARPGLNAFQRYNGPNSLIDRLPNSNGPNTNVTRAQARGLQRDTARYNDIGGSIGGPILKNRVFAFFAYETLRSRTTTFQNQWYETPAFDGAAPSGFISNTYLTFPGNSLVNATNLSATCANAGLTEGVNCQTVAGQGVDIGSPLKTARGTQDPTYVSTNNPGVGAGLDGIADISEFNVGLPDQYTQTQYNGRLDGDVTSKDHLAFAIYWVPVTHNTLNTARGYNQVNHNQVSNAYTIIYNHIFSSSFLNEARANAAGWRWNELTDNPQAPFGLPQDFVENPGSTGGSGGLQYFGAFGPSHLNQWTFGYKDVATKVLKSHTIKFGGEATQLHYLSDPLYNSRPSYRFYNVWDFLNDAPHEEDGQFNRFTGVPYASRFDEREWIYGGFIQDNWKATKNLTLTAGLRYNYFDSLYSKQGTMPHIAFGQGASTFTGLTNVRGGKVWDPDKANLGPQIGFAYNPDLLNHHMVVRGGYGINYNQEEIAISSNTASNPNDSVQISFNNSTPTAADPHIVYNVASSVNSIFGYTPNPNTIQAYGSNGLPTGTGFSLTAFPNHLRTQQVHHYSLDTQTDLGKQVVASVGYEGSSSKHLIFQSNAYVYGETHGIAPNPSVNYLGYFGDTGGANYNALLVDLKHNMAHNFLLDASFTWAKSMDDNSGPYSFDPYVYNPAYLRGRSDYNVGKAFKVYGVYTPKLFYGSNAFGRVLLNGFNISGIYNLHTGFPWTPVVNYPNVYYNGSHYGQLRPTSYSGTAGNDHSNTAFESATTRSSNFSAPINTYFSQYSATALASATPSYPAFSTFLPVPGVARNSFTGPRYSAVDATVTKAFGIPNHYLGERTGFEFRVDAFNLFNKTNLSPGIINDINNANFGISGAGLAGRQVQMQARLSF